MKWNLTEIVVRYDCGLDAQTAYDVLKQSGFSVTKQGKVISVYVYPVKVAQILPFLSDVAVQTG